MTLLREVLALTDKYQVTRLHELCMQAFQKGMGPENACQVLASAAAHFRLPDLRRQVLEMIWINAEEALTSCPSISPGLLEEILQPGLLCISNSELEVMRNDWCSRDSWKKRQADEEMVLLEAVIQRQRTRSEREREDLIAYHGQPFESDTIYSVDIFRSLWTRQRTMPQMSDLFGRRAALLPGSWFTVRYISPALFREGLA